MAINNDIGVLKYDQKLKNYINYMKRIPGDVVFALTTIVVLQS